MKMTDDQQKCFRNMAQEANCSNLKCALCQSVRWKIGDLLTPAHVNPLDDQGTAPRGRCGYPNFSGLQELRPPGAVADVLAGSSAALDPATGDSRRR